MSPKLKVKKDILTGDFRKKLSKTHQPSEQEVLSFVRIKIKSVFESTDDVAYNKITNHLWYLSEINICLAFFDNAVSNDMKRKMLVNLSKYEYV